MPLKRMTRCLAALLLLGAGSAHGGPAEDKLLACMRANIPPTLRIQQFRLESFDRSNGTRVLQGRLYAKRENNLLRAMLRLTAPVDLNGAAYLIREGEKSDEMYVYLPALGRTRRIQGGAGDGPLFGTDLSYADLKQVQNAFEGSSPAIEGQETIEGHAATLLGLTPHAESGSLYSRIRAAIDPKSCVALRVDFYEGQNIRKQLTAPVAALARSGNYWYAGEAEMKDLKLGTRTTLKITGVQGGEDVAGRFFDSRSFYLAN